MKKEKIVQRILFIFIFISEFIFGYYINHVKQLISGDSLSRVTNAFYVIYSKPPHLAALGFVWNPLPSFLELPFTLLWPFYKPIVTSALAGVIITSIFAAGSAVLIFRSFMEFKTSIWMSIIIVLLYAFNPYIFLYGANGMSEMIFIFFIIWTIVNLTKFMDDGQYQHFLKIAFSLCFAFLTRYESVPLIIGIAIIIVILIFTDNKDSLVKKSNLKDKLQRIEGIFIMLFTPGAFVVIVWIAVNYIIQGNGLYFLNSAYSNVGQSGSITGNLGIAKSIGNPLLTISFMFNKSIYFLIPFFLVILNRIIHRKLFKRDTLIFLILISSLYIMQFGLILKGLSAGWIRYFVYALPISIAWIPYEMKNVNKVWKFSSNFIAAILSAVLAVFVLLNSQTIPDQFNVLGHNKMDLTIQSQNTIADYINKKLPNSIILMDSFDTFSTIVNCNNQNNIIKTSDSNFNSAVNTPQKSSANYIVVPDPKTNLGKSDAINIKYPKLYKKGETWCTLEKTFNQFKLFKVKHINK
ncbi:MAG: glycosyltransferase family 39 protein [Clostridium sp.]|nr:glycosyltransferase family 39 protein [Clostridium sp.]